MCIILKYLKVEFEIFINLKGKCADNYSFDCGGIFCAASETDCYSELAAIAASALGLVVGVGTAVIFFQIFWNLVY